MVNPEREPLCGIVEADETIIPFRTKVVGRIRGWRTVILHPHVQEGNFLPDILEEDVDLILIVLVIFLLFGGGGYWGYRRWR